MITLKNIGQTFVKATQLLQPQSVHVDAVGIRHDRDFAMLEADDKFIGSGDHGDFFPLKFVYRADDDSMSLTLPGGREIVGPAAGSGARVDVDHAGLRIIAMAEVEGPWRETLSEYAGRPIRLARCVNSGGAVDVLPITFLTTGSVKRLERELGAPVDASRFRAGFVLNHDVEHAEDEWEGRNLRIGDALLKVRTAVPRCGITRFNPESGARDQDVMRALTAYRDSVALPDGMLPGYATPGFATFAEVVEPGSVKLGDKVEVLD